MSHPRRLARLATRAAQPRFDWLRWDQAAVFHPLGKRLPMGTKNSLPEAARYLILLRLLTLVDGFSRFLCLSQLLLSSADSMDQG
jgi:hypothetical protein